MCVTPDVLLRFARLCLAPLLMALPLSAQESEVPRTPTLPGVESPAFPYSEPEEVGLSGAALRSLGDRIAEWVAEGEIVGAEVLIIKDGRAVFHEAIGWNDVERDMPLRRNSIFRMRSMTKPLLGTAVLMLVEEGKLALDDVAAKYLPSFDTDRSRAITTRGLLTHTSGLDDHGSGDIGLPQRPDEYESLRVLVDDIGGIGSTGTPGEFDYSDSGSATLGAIVAEVSGMPVERFIETRILEPLRMADTHTRFTPDASWADRMNSTYRWSREACAFEQYWNPDMEQRFRYFRASGGLYSTVMDYARFMTMWMNKGRYGDVRLLSEATVEAALHPASDRGDGRRYGMHWTVRDTQPVDGLPAVFGHGGSDGTAAYAFPALDAIALYFTQSRFRSYREAFTFHLGQIPPFAEHSFSRWNAEIEAEWRSLQGRTSDAGFVEIPHGQLERFAGSYVLGDSPPQQVIVRGDTLLFARSGDVSPAPLLPLSPTTFIGSHECDGLVFRITFLPAEDGTVDRYRIETPEGWDAIFERHR